MPASSSAKSRAVALKTLITKLREYQSSFNDIWEFVEDVPVDAIASDMSIRLERLDELREKIEETVIEVKSHASYSEEKYPLDKERKDFSLRYYKAKSFLMDSLKELQVTVSPEQSFRATDSTAVNHLDHARLPQIRLQSFNGDINEWLSFRDLFTSLIHFRTDLPEVEKFHYLKGCLQGEPKSLIDPIQITRTNYQVAWDMLVSRYSNSKQLKKRQVQTVFDLPTLARESVADLHKLVEGFQRAVQTLDQIIQPVDYKDLLLVNLLISRLDPVTRRGWEEFSASKDQETLKDLTEFLQRRIGVLESLPSRTADLKGMQKPTSSSSSVKQRLPIVKTSFNTVQEPRKGCVSCSADHLLFQCQVFQRMTSSEKEALLRTHGLCRNCLKQGHQARDCRSKFSCRKCKGRHHSLVCFKPEKDDSKGSAASRTSSNESSNHPDGDGSSTQVANMAATKVTASTSSNSYSSQALLATAVVIIEDDFGNQYPARALLDSGSESNFLTEQLSQRLKASREPVNISVVGIGQSATKVKQRIRAVVRSRVSGFSRELNFLVLRKVTANLPTVSIDTTGWKIPQGIELADPTFFVSRNVDLVLGIEAFFEFFETGRQLSLGKQLPMLTESVFGWVVCGGTPLSGRQPITCNVSASKDLEEMVARFWSCEEVESSRAFSPKQARCETLFEQAVQRDADGRYTVPILKDGDEFQRLGESKDIAFRRLQGTERRLAKDASLRQQYTAFMDEYLALGHMRKVDEAQETVKRCYLPHHPVVKEASTTTKVRVVFDASCKTSTGISLNDTLHVGPVIQEDLRSIILRCRIKQIMLVSDIEKMFRQINILQEDRPLTCILWRPRPTEEVTTYELGTVTYGTKSAPFLATRTLHQLAMEEEDRFPLAAKAIREDTYMDDVITGADTIEEATDLRKQLVDMLKGGGFRLRKWASNQASTLQGLPEEELAIRTSEGINMDPDPSVKTLGLTWVPSTDEFKYQFNISPLDPSESLTKCKILSTIAGLFDPIGFLGPTILTAKIFLQQLWAWRNEDGVGLDWDQPVPSTVGERWQKFHEQLPLLNQISINRCVVIPRAVSIQIHCFSDASERAYGGCIYLRSQDAEGRVVTHLLTSKSKVAPLKCQTIPRLELCGALLSAQLYEKVRQSIKIDAPAYFWTDSTCVLRWLEASPSNWNTFVGNRVAKIQTLTEGFQWRHVPGVDNPADMISRGLSPEDLAQNDSWWHGPRWLEDEECEWPVTADSTTEDDHQIETRRTAVAGTSSTLADFNDWYISKFPNYTSLIRCTAVWQRLIRRLQTRSKEQPVGPLTNSELRQAESTIVRLIQRETFPEERKALAQGNLVSRKSPLRWFNPYLPEDKLLRVGGRLRHSSELEGTKHPLILPAYHRITRMIMEHYHHILLHAGSQLLLSTVRLKFWPLGGRNVARQVVHRCLKCFRAKPPPTQQFMGELPSSRVTVSRPFAKAGVDFFGPVFVRPGPRRVAYVAYVAVFICMATKAVHLELVSDLSTDRFLQALRRFVGRRGRCTDIFSDNGTNFVGARNRLQELFTLLRDSKHQEAVAKYCTTEGIQWHFNPPNAPHFGGLWEAAVKSAKHHLLRVVGEEPISPEDFQTLLVQVEACLNSRPITPISDDPNDLEPLTPGHFLIGSSLHDLPEPDWVNVPTNRLNRFQQLQQKFQGFWSRWRKEYLCQLQGRTKRLGPATTIEVGRLVVVCDKNLPPIRWKMGRITETHPGEDGVVRVVTLKTKDGFLKRPVERICILPRLDNSVVSSNLILNPQSLPNPNPILSLRRGIFFFFSEIAIISGWVRMFGSETPTQLQPWQSPSAAILSIARLCDRRPDLFTSGLLFHHPLCASHR